MSLLYLVFYCLTIYVTEGRVVRGIIGRNVSFSWTINNANDDGILIQHNKSDLVWVWPANDNFILNELDRVQVTVHNNTQETVIVTINILNIERNDSGMYTAKRDLNSELLNGSVLLETIDETLIPKIIIVRHTILDSTLVLQCSISSMSTGEFNWKLNGSIIENHGRYFQNDTFLFIRNLRADDQYNLYKCRKAGSEIESDPYKINIWIDHNTDTETTQTEDTKDNNHCTTLDLIMTEDTEESKHYTPTEPNRKENVEDIRFEQHWLYIVSGIGGALIVAFLACLLHTIIICLCVDKESNSNNRSALTDDNNDDGNENLKEENLHGVYWTITCNQRGEQSSVIDSGFQPHREPKKIRTKIVLTVNESEQSTRLSDQTVSEELDGYLSPIQSVTVEIDKYIHPIQSDSMNAGFLANDSDFEPPSESTKIRPNIVPTANELEQSKRLDYLTVSEEFDGTLNLIHSIAVKTDDYINPIHSDSVNEGVLAIDSDFKPPRESTIIRLNIVPSTNESEQSTRFDDPSKSEELDGYLSPVHSFPVDIDEYIHPIHTDPVNAGFVTKRHSTEIQTPFY